MLTAAVFVLFCVACTVLAFVRHPIYGLYFYIATTYVYPPGRWWGYVFGDLRWALLAAAVTTLAIVFHRGKLAAKPLWFSCAPFLILAMYVAWMWVQTAWALDVPEHVRGSTEMTKCLFAMWFVYRVVDSKEKARGLMLAHVLGCGLLGVFAYTVGRQGDRLDGVGGPNLDDANTLGMYFATAAVVAIGLILANRGWRRYLSVGCLALVVNGLVLTNSRGAFLGLTGGMLVLIACIARKHRWLFWSFMIVGALGVAHVVDQTFIDRMMTIDDVTSHDEDADTSARSRLAIAEGQMAMFADHPMGIGWRGTVVLSPRYLDRKWLTLGGDNPSRSSHSTYLTALTEQGVIGAMIYASLVLWVIGAVLQVRRLNTPQHDPELTTMAAAFCAGVVVVLVAGVAEDFLTKEVQFWLYAGLVSTLWLNGVYTRAERSGDEVAPLRRLPV